VLKTQDLLVPYLEHPARKGRSAPIVSGLPKFRFRIGAARPSPTTRILLAGKFRRSTRKVVQGNGADSCWRRFWAAPNGSS